MTTKKTILYTWEGKSVCIPYSFCPKLRLANQDPERCTYPVPFPFPVPLLLDHQTGFLLLLALGVWLHLFSMFDSTLEYLLVPWPVVCGSFLDCIYSTYHRWLSLAVRLDDGSHTKHVAGPPLLLKNTIFERLSKPIGPSYNINKFIL